MGTLRSTADCSGHTVNGVLLGDPVEVDGDPATFEWDDAAFPTGIVELFRGRIVVTADEPEV